MTSHELKLVASQQKLEHQGQEIHIPSTNQWGADILSAYSPKNRKKPCEGSETFAR
jgi:hypothetical protein